MQETLHGEFATREWHLWPPRTMRVVDWNIERGLKLPAILEFLEAQRADLLVIQEADLNARRTRYSNVAEEIARKLNMNYVFGYEFQELAEGTSSSPAYIGQATLSRWPLTNARVIRFHAQSDFWHPRWYVPNMPLFQERRGGRIALVVEIQFAGKVLTVYNLHLESRGSDHLRIAQLQEVLSDAESASPVLVSGDLNIDAHNGFPDTLFTSAGFCDAVDLSRSPTTPHRGLFSAGRIIDRAFIRGAVEANRGKIHNNVNASDHYPISFEVKFL